MKESGASHGSHRSHGFRDFKVTNLARLFHLKCRKLPTHCSPAVCCRRSFFSAKPIFFREATFFFGWRGCHDRAPALTSPPHDFFVRFMLQRKTNVFKSKAVCASLNERAVRIKLIFIGQFQFFFIFAIGNGVWCLHRSVFH